MNNLSLEEENIKVITIPRLTMWGGNRNPLSTAQPKQIIIELLSFTFHSNQWYNSTYSHWQECHEKENLGVLQRLDLSIVDISWYVSHVALYEFIEAPQVW